MSKEGQERVEDDEDASQEVGETQAQTEIDRYRDGYLPGKHLVRFV